MHNFLSSFKLTFLSITRKFYRHSFLRNVSGYLIANAVSGLISFLLLLVLSRYLSASDFGIFAVYSTLAGIFSILMNLGMNGALSRYYYELDEKQFPILFGSCIILVGLGGLFWGSLAFSLESFLLPLINFPVGWLWAVVATAVSQIFTSLAMAIFQARCQLKLYLVTQISQVLMNGVLSILFIVAFSEGWQGRVYAQVLSSVILGFMLFCYLLKSGAIIFTRNQRYYSKALKYGLPLVAHGIGGVLIALSDRLILAKITTFDQIGLYAIAAQIISIYVFMIDAFNKAYASWLFTALSREKVISHSKLVRITYLYMITVLISAILFSTLSGWLVKTVFNENYSEVIPFILPLSIAAAFMGMYYMVTLYLQFLKKTLQLSAITFSISVVNIILCFLFAQWYGAIGAAYALIITQLLMFIACWAAAAYLFPMPWLSILRVRFWR